MANDSAMTRWPEHPDPGAGQVDEHRLHEVDVTGCVRQFGGRVGGDDRLVQCPGARPSELGRPSRRCQIAAVDGRHRQGAQHVAPVAEVGVEDQQVLQFGHEGGDIGTGETGVERMGGEGLVVPAHLVESRVRRNR